MVDLRKPEKRAPRPRKRIARTMRVRKVKKTSRGKMGRTADRLFSLIVRHPGTHGGRCAYHSAKVGNGCAGSLQCAHIVSRSYRSVRWDETNAIPLCAAAHTYFTHHPLEWESFIVSSVDDRTYGVMGRAFLEDLKRRALQRWDGDIEGVCVRLAARAVALGIQP